MNDKITINCHYLIPSLRECLQFCNSLTFEATEFYSNSTKSLSVPIRAAWMWNIGTNKLAIWFIRGNSYALRSCDLKPSFLRGIILSLALGRYRLKSPAKSLSLNIALEAVSNDNYSGCLPDWYQSVFLSVSHANVVGLCRSKFFAA